MCSSITTEKTCFSWAFWFPLYLHTKSTEASTATAAGLSSLQFVRRSGLQTVDLGAWYMTRSLFSNQTGDGNRGCRPNSGFPQIDQETQGPGANKTARAVMQPFSHCRRAACPAGGERQMEREARRRQRRQALPVQGIPVKVVSHPRRVYRDHCVLLCVKRLPVPTVEHLSTELEPSSRSGPEDRWALACTKGLAIEQIERWHHKFRVTVVFETLL